MPWWKSATTDLYVLGGVLPILGFLLLALYAGSTRGPHLAYFSIGALIGLAALVVGCVVGFLFGVPRAVSAPYGSRDVPVIVGQNTPPKSEPTRDASIASTSPQPEAESASGASSVSTSTQPEHYLPSTNLEQVSDWLTKVLLGAGLVQLGRLGRPVGGLVDTVAGALQPRTAIAIGSTARVLAGGIILFYTSIGFLDGYVITTLWYQQRLEGRYSVTVQRKT
jgi:hypothetical protein